MAAYDLAALVLEAAIARAGIPADRVDQVILGQSYQNGEYVNMARMGLLTAGWPESVPGTTIDSRCCTGLDVVRLGAALIRHLVEEYWKKQHFKHGYDLINTPHIGKSWLWETSGHLGFYQENMYSPLTIDEWMDVAARVIPRCLCSDR